MKLILMNCNAEIKEKYFEILLIIEGIIVFFIAYSWIVFKGKSYDLKLIFLLILVEIIKKKLKKETFILNKKILWLGIFWIFWMTFSYFYTIKMDGEVIKLKKIFYVNVVFKGILLSIILAQIKLEEMYYKILTYSIPIMILIHNYKGMKILHKLGIFANRNTWNNEVAVNHYSFLLGDFIIIIMGLIFGIKNRKMRLGLITVLVFLNIILFLGPRSRNTILGVLLITFFYFVKWGFKSKKKINKIIVLLSIIVSISVIGIKFGKELRIDRLINKEKMVKSEGRVDVYKEGIRVLKEDTNLLVGNGFYAYYGNKIKLPREKLSSFHNNLLDLTITQGILGGLLYLLFFLLVIRDMWKASLSMGDEEEKYLIDIAQKLSFYLLFIGLFDDALYAGRVSSVVFLFIGLGYSWINYIKEKNRENENNNICITGKSN